MKILSIDTASNLCTVAVLEAEKCIKEIIVNDARNHSEKIMPVIEQALSESKLTLQDINLIVCDKGPGSFTGIRIGVGTVLACKDSLNIPCVGISSLEVLAYNIKKDGIICSTIDCKNNNCYFALYELNSGNYNVLIEPCAKSVNDVLDLLNSQYYNKCISFVGDGIPSEKLHSIYDNNADSEVTKNIISSYLNVENLGTAGYKKFINNNKVGEEILPLYLKKPQAQIQLEEKLKAKI